MTEEKVFFGKGLCGILHKNDGPAIVMIHSFKGGKDEHGRFVKAAERFYQEGYCVFRFDFRGTGESEGKFEDMTIEREVEDALSAIDYVKNLGLGEIGVLGLSLGGEISILASPKRDVKALVLWAPATSSEKWEDRFDEKQRKDFETKGKTTIVSSSTGKLWTVGKAFYESSISVKVEDEVKKLKCPVLIIHGDKDQTVPLEHSKQALGKMNVVKELKVIEGANHRLYEQIDEVIELSLNWFKKYL